MTTRTDVVRGLEVMGDAAPADPSRRFVDELEARLVNDLEDPPVALRGLDDPARSSRSKRPLVTMGSVAAALVLIVGIFFAALEEPPTNVATPVGSPDSPSSVGDEPEKAGAESSERDEAAAGRTDTGDNGAGVTAVDDDSADRREPPEAATSEERGAADSAGSAPGGERPFGEPSEARFRLEASSSATGADLTWDSFGGDDFFAYIVLRSEGEDPEYPPGDDGDTRWVHRSTDRDDTTWSDHRPTVSGETSYMVVVIDEAGRELARSNVAALNASVGLTIKLL